MRTSDFDFELPERLIAKRPLEKRDASRLLRWDDEAFVDGAIADLPFLVQEGDVWVVNDTRVIPARLLGQKPSGGKVEILLLEPTGATDVWTAWGKANKPLKQGDKVLFGDGFHAEVLARDGKCVEIRLVADKQDFTDVAQAIEAHGHMPLPPYIDRPDSEEDKQRYQTVFATHDGAVAAPTAGLHLTPELMNKMEAAGASFVHVTLHVGPGTFQPVQVDDVHAHKMHEEAYVISKQAAEKINQAKAEGRRVLAVGTTSLRTLEAACVDGVLQAGSGRTDIFIYPGYDFQMVDALLTNFHLPQSTLLMLVSALAGKEQVLKAYDYAIEKAYRFYSYGDAMFVLGKNTCK
ncbi:MAG: tRNA preQ1(34) S-adenosylmethionine ribosyltransferase-isomerase QueA [Mariprofundaceae bacterium]|nr:tRNA preQ1(34) S-adenosylmethionine ribosyltransferase-isomerase QueA [Mariprofundaceae bacterium]